MSAPTSSDESTPPPVKADVESPTSLWYNLIISALCIGPVFLIAYVFLHAVDSRWDFLRWNPWQYQIPYWLLIAVLIWWFFYKPIQQGYAGIVNLFGTPVNAHLAPGFLVWYGYVTVTPDTPQKSKLSGNGDKGMEVQLGVRKTGPKGEEVGGLGQFYGKFAFTWRVVDHVKLQAYLELGPLNPLKWETPDGKPGQNFIEVEDFLAPTILEIIRGYLKKSDYNDAIANPIPDTLWNTSAEGINLEAEKIGVRVTNIEGQKLIPANEALAKALGAKLYEAGEREGDTAHVDTLQAVAAKIKRKHPNISDPAALELARDVQRNAAGSTDQKSSLGTSAMLLLERLLPPNPGTPPIDDGDDDEDEDTDQNNPPPPGGAPPAQNQRRQQQRQSRNPQPAQPAAPGLLSTIVQAVVGAVSGHTQQQQSNNPNPPQGGRSNRTRRRNKNKGRNRGQGGPGTTP